MQTTIYEIELNDGRIFRIFCANSTQIQKVLRSFHALGDKVKDTKEIVNGIHTTKQWQTMFAKI